MNDKWYRLDLSIVPKETARRIYSWIEDSYVSNNDFTKNNNKKYAYLKATDDSYQLYFNDMEWEDIKYENVDIYYFIYLYKCCFRNNKFKQVRSMENLCNIIVNDQLEGKYEK